MSLIIEKLEGGYIITHHTARQIATAEHVARLIFRHWPDVVTQLRPLMASHEIEVEKNSPD